MQFFKKFILMGNNPGQFTEEKENEREKIPHQDGMSAMWMQRCFSSVCKGNERKIW
ncbi:MAG: hypothetical protein JW882_09280 [Deltaproteobacteria bacterium]|nr:hypothetical protein [Deltaproteobacteria bacterium]